MINKFSSSSGQSGGTGEAGGRKRKRNRWGDEADKGTWSAVHSYYFIHRAKAPHIRLSRPGFLLGDFWEAY